MSEVPTNSSSNEETVSVFEVQVLLEEIERLLADPNLPEEAKEMLKNHELVSRFQNGRRDNATR